MQAATGNTSQAFAGTVVEFDLLEGDKWLTKQKVPTISIMSLSKQKTSNRSDEKSTKVSAAAIAAADNSDDKATSGPLQLRQKLSSASLPDTDSGTGRTPSSSAASNCSLDSSTGEQDLDQQVSMARRRSTRGESGNYLPQMAPLLNFLLFASQFGNNNAPDSSEHFSCLRVPNLFKLALEFQLALQVAANTRSAVCRLMAVDCCASNERLVR